MEFKFEQNEIEMILAGLGELPVKYSMELFLKIKREAVEQLEEQNQTEKE